MVGLEVVGHDDVARTEAGREHVANVALEAGRGHGAIEPQPWPDPVQGEGSNNGFVLAAVDRRGGVRSLPPRRPSVARRVPQMAPGLIHEDQILGADRRDFGPPSRASGLVPFAGAQRLFFRVWCNRASARLMVAVLTSTPDASRHQAHCSANVPSARSVSRSGKAAMSAPSFTAGGPGTG